MLVTLPCHQLSSTILTGNCELPGTSWPTEQSEAGCAPRGCSTLLLTSRSSGLPGLVVSPHSRAPSVPGKTLPASVPHVTPSSGGSKHQAVCRCRRQNREQDKVSAAHILPRLVRDESVWNTRYGRGPAGNQATVRPQGACFRTSDHTCHLLNVSGPRPVLPTAKVKTRRYPICSVPYASPPYSPPVSNH